MRYTSNLPCSGLTLAFIFTLFVGVSGCQAPKKATSTDTLSIPYERHILDNGLTVIIHEDHSDPVAHVDVTYHVGSAREELGKSGFAHLFEHMMFQGSENVADEEHMKTVTETGGRFNGTTSRDRTNYFETVPANHLETILWLEADRMGFFLDGITQEKFEIQRATVKNEKGQNYDNRAYGRAFELITKALYPYGHPYSWLPIGDLEDLDRATAEDLQNFFLRWYGPNNATLTIGGDVNPDEILPLVEKYFGGIAQGPTVTDLKTPRVELDTDRYVSYYDDKIRFPAVTFSYPTVPMFHSDAPALACLAGILGAGKDSYLYQNFVATQKAINASASHGADELAGEFFMFVLPYPGLSLADFESELRASFNEFEQNGVSDEDLQKFKARYETGFINGLETVSGKVTKLAYYQTFANNPNKVSDELDAYLSVTKEDVMRVYQQYIKNKPAVILSILADAKGLPAKPDNFTIPSTGDNPYPTTDYSGMRYVKADDDFDRSIKPSPKAAKLISPPEYWQTELDNGVRVLGTEQTELPKIHFSISLKGGYILDNLDESKLGLVGLSTSMLNTSTENFSETEIAKELALIGSSISFSSQAQRFNISVSSLTKNFDRTLDILEEKLYRPAFNQKDFTRLQQQTLESAKSSTKQASSIASMAWNRLTYGETHMMGRPDTFLIPTVPNLTVEDAKAFHDEHFSLENAEIIVVGDISQKQFISKITPLLTLNKPAPAAPQLPATPTYDKTTLFFIDKPGAVQSELRIGYLTDLSYDATGEFFKRYLMNFPLGGAFNSRISLNIREDKGLSYGAGSYFEGSEIPGRFVAYSSVKGDSTDIAVTEIIKEISNMQKQGIDDKELKFIKDSIGQRDALQYESNYQKAGFLGKILRYDIEPSFVDERKDIVANITKEEINALAKKHLPLDKMIILVVGDKASIYDDLNALGYDIVELDEEGAVLQ